MPDRTSLVFTIFFFSRPVGGLVYFGVYFSLLPPSCSLCTSDGGRWRTRTADPLRVKQVL
jgi:hypothetical protein